MGNTKVYRSNTYMFIVFLLSCIFLLLQRKFCSRYRDSECSVFTLGEDCDFLDILGVTFYGSSVYMKVYKIEIIFEYRV